MKFYPIADRITRADAEALGVKRSEVSGPLPSFEGMAGRIAGRQDLNVCAIYSGHRRPPRKGEWYLSGARVAAYRAPNDLSSEYHIATLVVVEKTVTETTRIVTM